MENKTIGAHFKDIRESKGLRLEDIAQKTKINISILKYLEANNFDKLPNKTYVRGFVQNYAKTLGIDIKESVQILDETLKKNGESLDEMPTNPILDQFVAETDLSSELKRHEVQEKITNLIHLLFKKKTIIFIVVVLVGLFGLKHLVNFFGQLKVEGTLTEERTRTEEKEELSPEIKASSEDLFDLKVSEKLNKEEKVAPKEAEVEAPKEEIKVAQKPEVEEKEKETPPKEAPKTQTNLKGKYPYLDFYPAPRNLFTIVENAPENDNLELLPANIKNGMDAGKANVYIRAVDGDTWISYKIDDEKITRYVLKQGRYVFLQGEQVLLFMGNINVAKVFYNNELIDTNSRTGVKSLIFPEENSKDFVFPLFPNYKGMPLTAEEYRENMAPKPE